MSSYSRKRSYSPYSKGSYSKYSKAKRKPSSYNVKRATYTKGAVKSTAELKQWYFAVDMPRTEMTHANLALGNPFGNVQINGNGVFSIAANTGICCLSHGIGQGSGANQRIGNKITNSSVDISMVLEYGRAGFTSQFIAPPLCLYVVMDTQWSGAATINLFDLCSVPGSIPSVMVRNNQQRFKVLKKILINPTTFCVNGSNVANSNYATSEVAYQKTISLKKMETKYRAATANLNTPADVQSNMLFLAFGLGGPLNQALSDNVLALYIAGSVQYYDS